MKKLIVFGIAIACIWLMYRYPYEMINPGELVEGHHELNNKCLSCHNPLWGISNEKCISCHKLSEIGKGSLTLTDTQKTNQKILFHQNLTYQKCSSCHTDHKGLKPATAISSFAHDVLSEASLSNCSSCHNKPSDIIHQQVSVSCNSCHNTKGWKSSVVFNHETIQGATKTNCASCHQKPNDSFHLSAQGNCDKCHTTSKWLPSSFAHSAYFPLDNHHNATCITCHTNNNFSTYTCYGCHQHSQNNIMENHSEHGMSNISNCTSCHKSGNEHDIRMNGNSDRELNQNEINDVKEYLNSPKRENRREHDEKREGDDDD